MNSNHWLLVVMWSKIPDETRWGREDGRCSSRHNGDVQRIPLTTSRVWWDAKKKPKTALHPFHMFTSEARQHDGTLAMSWFRFAAKVAMWENANTQQELQCFDRMTNFTCTFPSRATFFSSSNIYLLSYCCLICVFRKAAYLDLVSKIATNAKNAKAKHLICPLATVFVCICDVHIK